MTTQARASSPYPRWAAALDLAVWVTGPDRAVHWINRQAASLLRANREHLLGRPCRETVKAVNVKGRPLCGAECPIMQRVRRGRALPPLKIRFDGGAGDAGSAEGHAGPWVRILLIPVRRARDGGIYLVHCVISSEREKRMERYLRSVAGRWTPRRGSMPPCSAAPLTGREAQILDLLTRDNDLHSIAGKLGVSHVTVRNHVQHLLSKLGVHSIEEAVARSLLS